MTLPHPDVIRSGYRAAIVGRTGSDVRTARTMRLQSPEGLDMSREVEFVTEMVGTLVREIHEIEDIEIARIETHVDEWEEEEGWQVRQTWVRRNVIKRFSPEMAEIFDDLMEDRR